MPVNFFKHGKVNGWLKNSRPAFAFNRCALCQYTHHAKNGFCNNCTEDLPFNHNHCDICCEPLQKNSICGNCLLSPPKYHERVLAAYQYRYPINKLLSQLKFHQDITLAKRLITESVGWFIRRLKPEDKPDLILPVPLHPERLKQRGYNQAQLLAQPLAVSLDIPLGIHHCLRIKNTLPQSELNAKERKRNVKGVFRCTNEIMSKHVAIFDDVITTGATTYSLAETLISAGANRVEIWALAKRALNTKN